MRMENEANTNHQFKRKGNIMQINKAWKWLFNPPLDGPSAIILLRLMAGGVFLWEGILKFVYTTCALLRADVTRGCGQIRVAH
jgi:hypothetical protein